MAAKIEIEKMRAGEFRVLVIEGQSQSCHRVTLKPEYHRRIAGDKPDKLDETALIKRSFEFLLEREPKESILAEFDLQVISRYFPEYEHEIKRPL